VAVVASVGIYVAWRRGRPRKGAEVTELGAGTSERPLEGVNIGGS
jgi:hypothetical protein